MDEESGGSRNESIGTTRSNSYAITLKAVGAIFLVAAVPLLIFSIQLMSIALDAYDNTPQAYLLMGAPFLLGALVIGGLGAWFIRLGRRA